MRKTIPRHSLVVAVGANDDIRTELVEGSFPRHEIVSADRTGANLCGQPDDARLGGVLFPEMRRQVALKLSLGERVVVNASNLKKDDRLSFARLANEIGVPVFYLLASPLGASTAAHSLWKNTMRDLYRGDGIAEVVDIDDPFTVVPWKAPDLDQIQCEWSGITIIGDVHGMQQSLLDAIKWARLRHNYIIFLGDVIDYGPQTLEVADVIYSLVMRGEAELMLGNHERKIARWAKQVGRGYAALNLSDGNRVTTNALLQASVRMREHWLGRFNGLVQHAQHVRVLGDFVLSHAAIHPGFWDGTASRKEIETSALFGEFEAPASNVFVPRTYSWVEQIPAGKTVIVGHDIRRKEAPLIIQGAGLCVFLDTGCGKGGKLSSVDLRWTKEGMKLQNFNMY